ncbi:MAG: hypothetical protein COW88_03240 [Candidatus Lloydbacteria bacterium CG22_combo_CG10-13_8_21_14_all_47_15]|uniref:SHS2 domain-containing protein n=1 Tax=Candidatus Lloydbacteria bacterium CG22_combo_CG10-13_8_21_14_all_47_15 TaxID=1974635 RepID=A0A2H0CT79_9BACT|nr:MAG: hypothetical protein COW88_03240 [Candidatus Lloydbacteria bacterium CG22_combo_CG10-13_8_21_14_all_47_15]
MKYSFPQTFFPPPAFLAMRAAGIAISESDITLINLFSTRRGIDVASFESWSLPDGSISDGSVAAPELVQEALRHFHVKENVGFARIAIPEAASYLVRLLVPVGTDAAIRAYLTEHLEEHVPLRPENALFDYIIISVLENTADILLSVASRQVVDSYLGSFAGTNIIPLSVEIDIQAIARAVVPAYETDAVAIVDIGRFRTIIAIVADGFVRFATTTDIGSIHVESAHQVKEKKNADVAQKRMEALRAFGEELGAEVDRHLLYWKTHRKGDEERDLERIIVSGTEMAEPDVFDHIVHYLPLHPTLANPWQNVLFRGRKIPPMTRRESFKYTTAIGLALSSFSRE